MPEGQIERDDIVYRYEPLGLDVQRRNWTLDILRDSQFFISSPTVFNDPFDCQLPFKITDEGIDYHIQETLAARFHDNPTLNLAEEFAEKNEARKLLRSEKGKEYFEREIYRKNLERSGVKSFCGKEGGEKHNTMMWAHYASNHNGICLVFVTDSPVFRGVRKVDYREKFVPVPMHVPGDEPTKMFQLAFFQKASYWKYEDERRIVFQDGANKYYPFDRASLVEVQFGLGTPQSDIDLVTQILKEKKYPGVNTYKMKKSQTEYRLEPEPIEEINFYKEYNEERYKK
jgi:hypothetical protein